MEKLNLRQRFALLVYGFTAAAFGGWVYEEICIYVMYRQIYNRGMLHLTICPIYGFGAWGLYLLLHRVRKPVWFYILSVIVASVFEYACACLLEFAFHRTYWTYSDWPLSIDDRISLISSGIFGLLALLFANGILPVLRKQVQKHSGTADCIAAACILAVIAADFIIVVLHY